AFGSLKSSADNIGKPKMLLGRMLQDGYLYLPGFLDRHEVLRARDSITNRLAAEGLLHPDYPAFEGMAKPKQRTSFRPDLAFGNRAIESLIYAPKVIEFYRELLGGPIRHYDFTWFRPVGPGKGTPPHCDLVYMGRGTKQVFTMWVPYGDISLELGGLMILENSHKKSDLLRNYLRRDVDSYCLNRPGAEEAKTKERSVWDGSLAKNPVAIRQKLASRWLTAEFHVGDVAYLRPPNFKMVEDPDITIQFDTNSWVENWVFTMPMSFQTSLLAHEQGHYDIGSLNAGDFFAELESINGSAFATARAGSTAVQDLRSRLGPVQPIHNKYDRDTNHGLNAGPQAAWTAALANARLPTNTLLGSLSAAGLFP